MQQGHPVSASNERKATLCALRSARPRSCCSLSALLNTTTVSRAVHEPRGEAGTPRRPAAGAAVPGGRGRSSRKSSSNPAAPNAHDVTHGTGKLTTSSRNHRRRSGRSAAASHRARRLPRLRPRRPRSARPGGWEHRPRLRRLTEDGTGVDDDLGRHGSCRLPSSRRMTGGNVGWIGGAPAGRPSRRRHRGQAHRSRRGSTRSETSA